MSRFATLDSLRNRDGGKEDEDDDRNEYYAGGARRDGGSGLAVVGGPGDNRGPPRGNAAEDIFNRAESDAAAAGAAARTITMYRGGFTVDNGPFRRLDDPANARFLSDMARGHVPSELAEGATGDQPVNVALVDKREQDYVAPPTPAYVAYGGSGQTAGGSTVAAAAVVTADASAAMPEVPEVDSTLPATTLQLRLHDGRRVRAQLNLSHTVAHIQAFVRREGAGDQPYILLHGFPPVQITDFTQTLEQAGLKGASITQKLAT